MIEDYCDSLSKNLKDEFSKIEKELDRDYQRMIIEKYSPIFKEVGSKVQGIMELHDISKIGLSPNCLTFSKDGNFYCRRGGKHKECDLEQIAEIYKADYVNRQWEDDNRGVSEPSTQEALRDAMGDFIICAKEYAHYKLSKQLE